MVGWKENRALGDRPAKPTPRSLDLIGPKPQTQDISDAAVRALFFFFHVILASRADTQT